MKTIISAFILAACATIPAQAKLSQPLENVISGSFIKKSPYVSLFSFPHSIDTLNEITWQINQCSNIDLALPQNQSICADIMLGLAQKYARQYHSQFDNDGFIASLAPEFAAKSRASIKKGCLNHANDSARERILYVFNCIKGIGITEKRKQVHRIDFTPAISSMFQEDTIKYDKVILGKIRMGIICIYGESFDNARLNNGCKDYAEKYKLTFHRTP